MQNTKMYAAYSHLIDVWQHFDDQMQNQALSATCQ